MHKTQFLLVIALFSLCSGFAWIVNTTLETPTNQSWTFQDNDTIQFDFIQYGNETMACYLWLTNISGSWSLAGLDTAVVVNTSTMLYSNFSLTENYTYGWWWYVNCSNATSGNYSASEEWMMYIDRTNSSIQFTASTTQTGNYSQDYIEVDLTANDNTGSFDTMIFYLYNSTDLVNWTSTSSSPLTLNFTGLAEDTYYMNATVNDSAGNTNETATLTIVLDTTQPMIQLTAPSTLTGTHSQSYIEATVTSSDAGSGINTITAYLINSSGLVNSTSGSSSPLVMNSTGLVDGTYYLNATIIDWAGNSNLTSVETIILDTSAPDLSITNANASTQYVSSSYGVAFSVSDPLLEA
ncbi:MAG: hypothetical protein GOU99_02770, partial [Candidatus Altiarchaeota archaeon]|nr:hypothetical protein [Candidatus Altiarchaeota archaeon]